eukprot:Opistho-1_new@104121
MRWTAMASGAPALRRSVRRVTLGPRLPSHQPLQRLRRRQPAVEHGHHGGGDGHVDAQRLRARQHGGGAVDAFCHVTQRSQHLGQRAALRQLQADLPVARQVAGGGEHQIAQAAEAHEGVDARAQGRAQARDLGQAAGDERGARVEAQAHAVGNAGGDGDDVLDRATHLHAHRVGRGVEAQRFAVEGLDGLVAQRLVGAGGHQRRGLAARYLEREARARQHAHPGGRRHFARHLVAERAGAGLEALAQPPQAGAAGGAARQHLAQARHGGGDDDQAAVHLGVRDRRVQVGREAQRGGQHHARQVALVVTGGRDLRGLGRLRARQHGGGAVDAFCHVTQRSQHLGQRAALRQLQADLPVARQVAGGGEHQIAQAAEAHEGVDARAQGRAQARDLGQAAGDERGAR